ncbi:hypothetical protein GOQ04_14770 [Emticicia sp. ODNR4P]|nr:hypothetical protein [Emticicia sp. ODNR4P]
MQQGDKVRCVNINGAVGFAGELDGRKYNPWVDTTSNRSFLTYLIPFVGQAMGAIDLATGYQEYDSSAIGQELKFLAESDPDPSSPMHLFIGGETHENERRKMVEFEKGDDIGVYTGRSKYKGGVEYVQVVTELRGYTGTGNDFLVYGNVWYRAEDVTNEKVTTSNKKLTGNTDTGTGNGNGNSNNTIWYVVGAILLSLVGFFIWKSNKK